MKNIKLPLAKRKQKESPATLNRLLNKRINFNVEKRTDKSLSNQWMITANPHIKALSSTSLERTLKLIFSKYYKWLYGSKYYNYKEEQLPFTGVIELQNRNDGYHTHFVMTADLEQIKLFYGYFYETFKQLYPRTTFRCECMYDEAENGWGKDYCSTISHKDKCCWKRRLEAPIYISNLTFQGQIDDRAYNSDLAEIIHYE